MLLARVLASFPGWAFSETEVGLLVCPLSRYARYKDCLCVRLILFQGVATGFFAAGFFHESGFEEGVEKVHGSLS